MNSKATNGVVIATDKKVQSVLVDSENYEKIQSITPTTGKYYLFYYNFNSSYFIFLLYFKGFVYSGMGPDFRVLVRSARKASQKYFLTYR